MSPAHFRCIRISDKCRTNATDSIGRHRHAYSTPADKNTDVGLAIENRARDPFCCIGVVDRLLEIRWTPDNVDLETSGNEVLLDGVNNFMATVI